MSMVCSCCCVVMHPHPQSQLRGPEVKALSILCGILQRRKRNCPQNKHRPHSSELSPLARAHQLRAGYCCSSRHRCRHQATGKERVSKADLNFYAARMSADVGLPNDGLDRVAHPLVRRPSSRKSASGRGLPASSSVKTSFTPIVRILSFSSTP